MTHEEMQNELLRMEADMIQLDGIVRDTANNLLRLSDLTTRLVNSQQQAWDAINRNSDAMREAWDAISALSKRIDRFIAGQGDGHNGALSDES